MKRLLLVVVCVMSFLIQSCSRQDLDPDGDLMQNLQKLAAFGHHEKTYLTPDGNYVAAPPHMTPDGHYVGGVPHMTPDGHYVGGVPHLTPEGEYVGGTPHLTPDGHYVGGNPVLTPEGDYVGDGQETD